MKLLSKWAALSLCFCCACVAAEGTSRPDDHAPIGVMIGVMIGAMDDHNHEKGKWMISYRYMLMQMQGNRNGSDRMKTSEVLMSGTGNYQVSPTEMDMAMHTVGLMYAPTENLTLMAMIPYIDNSMEHETAMGGMFSTQSSELGDISLTALSSLGGELLWQLGLSIPTGDLDQEDLTPMGNAVLPYPMQIGSGTFNLIAGLGHGVKRDHDSYGFQVRGIMPLGENDENYSVGNKFTATGWYARKLNHNVSVSIRGLYEFRDNYDGNDPRYAMAQAVNLVPTLDPNLRGGSRLDIALGANWLLSSGHRLSLEYHLPAWPDLDGPQLETDSVLTFGWQLAI